MGKYSIIQKVGYSIYKTVEKSSPITTWAASAADLLGLPPHTPHKNNGDDGVRETRQLFAKFWTEIRPKDNGSSRNCGFVNCISKINI